MWLLTINRYLFHFFLCIPLGIIPLSNEKHIKYGTTYSYELREQVEQQTVSISFQNRDKKL